MKKYLIIGSLAFSIFLVLLIFSLGFFVASSQGQKILLGFVNDQIPGSISMDNLSFSFLKKEIEIHGLKIQEPDKKKVATVEKIYIGLDLSRLFDHEIIFKKIEISTPCFYIAEKKNGQLNIAACFTDLKKQPEPVKPDNGAFVLPINIILDQFSLEKGYLAFESQNISIKTNDISIKGSGNLANEIMELGLATGSATLLMKNENKANQIKQDKLKMDGLNLALSYQKGALSLVDLNISSKPAKLSLKGSLSDLFQTPRADIAMDLSADLEQISHLLPEPFPMEAIFKAKAKITGTLADPWIIVSVNSGKGKIASRPFDGTDLKLNLKKSILTLEKLTASLDGGQVWGKGRADLNQAFPKGFLEKGFPEKISGNLTLGADNFEPQIILEQEGLPNIYGKYSFRIAITGTPEKPEATLYLNAMDAGYENFPRIDAKMDLAFLNNQLHIKQFDIGCLGSSLGISGRIKPMKNGKILSPEKIEIDLEAVSTQINFDQINSDRENLNQDRLRNLIPKELIEKGILQGMVAMDGSVSGTLNNPYALLNISGQNLAGQSINTGIELELKERILSLKKFIADLEGGQVSGQGKVDLTQVFPKGFMGEILPEKIAADLNLNTDKFDPQAILKQKGLPDIHGKYSFDANIKTSPAHPVASLHVSAINAGYKDFPRADAVVDLGFSNDHLVMEKFALTCLGSTLALTGKIKLMDKEQILIPEQMDFTADLIFNGKKLEPFFELAGIKELKGAIDGTAQLRGNLKGVEQIEANLLIDKLGLDYKKEYTLESSRIRANLKQGYLEFFPARLNFPDRGFFDLEAKGYIDKTIELDAKGKIPAQAAQPFTNALTSIKGDITTSIHALVGKDMKKNIIKGSIELNEISMVIGETGQKLHHINGVILANPDRVEIREIKGQLDTGNFAMSGDMKLADFSPDKFKFQFQANALPLSIPDQMEALFKTDLSFSGSPDKARLAGTIILESGEWMGNFSLEKTAFEKIMGRTRNQTTPDPGSGDSMADKIELDLIVRADTPFLINNNLAYLEVNPNIKIIGTAGNPAVSGRAALPSGTVNYNGKQFEVTKGIVDFINPYGIEPELDLVAEHQVRDWNIVLKLTGTPDNLILKLSSDPKQEDGDILSLLLTGKTTNELIHSEGGTTSSPASLVAGMAATSLAGKVKETIGLDIFEVEMKENNDSALGDVNLTVGKELTDKITVTYGMETKEGEMIQKTATDYKLSDKFSVSGFQNTQGNYGAEVKYRLEFK